MCVTGAYEPMGVTLIQTTTVGYAGWPVSPSIFCLHLSCVVMASAVDVPELREPCLSSQPLVTESSLSTITELFEAKRQYQTCVPEQSP